MVLVGFLSATCPPVSSVTVCMYICRCMCSRIVAERTGKWPGEKRKRLGCKIAVHVRNVSV